jgi:hypothetical protein
MQGSSAQRDSVVGPVTSKAGLNGTAFGGPVLRRTLWHCMLLPSIFNVSK